MTRPRRTALIADDEPLLRESLALQLSRAWPELEVVAEARNGREAIERFEALRPDVCFLDVHMPGLSGVDAARHIGRRAHVVFVTAFDHYAVEAFAQGALDYLLKPVEQPRLEETVRRLEERMAAARPAGNSEDLIRELEARRLRPRPSHRARRRSPRHPLRLDRRSLPYPAPREPINTCRSTAGAAEPHLVGWARPPAAPHLTPQPRADLR